MRRLTLLAAGLNILAIPWYAALWAQVMPERDILRPTPLETALPFVCAAGLVVMLIAAWSRRPVIGAALQILTAAFCIAGMLWRGEGLANIARLGRADLVELWPALVVLFAFGALIALAVLALVRAGETRS